MVAILCTLLMIAVLMYGIIKKYHTVMLLFTISLITLGIWSLLTGTSVMGKTTSGNLFLDLFELIYSTAQKQLPGTVLVVMSVLGYVNYMDHIKASEVFALVIAKPLKKLKSPYLLAACTIILGAFLKLVIPSGVSMVSLLIATIYPVLIQVGVTKQTAASALVLSSVVVWGPAESITYLVFSLGKITSISVPEFFVTHQFLIALLIFATLLIVFPITSKYFDRKENVKASTEVLKSRDYKELGLPVYYMFLPLLPLLFVLTFSSLVLKSIVISVVAANFLSLFISMAIHMINRRNIKEVFNGTQAFFSGIGDFIGKVGFVIVAGSVFSTAIANVGGMTKVVQLISNAGGGYVILTVVGSILAAVVIACTGSITANMNLFAPLFVNIAEITGGNLLTMFNALIFAGGLGSGMTPVSGTAIIVSGTTETPIPTILKRNLIPLAASLIMVLVGVLLFQ